MECAARKNQATRQQSETNISHAGDPSLRIRTAGCTGGRRGKTLILILSLVGVATPERRIASCTGRIALRAWIAKARAIYLVPVLSVALLERRSRQFLSRKLETGAE